MPSRSKLTCLICNQLFPDTRLSIHIQKEHKLTPKVYYDSFLKPAQNSGLCLTCGKETKFHNLISGYSRYCSNKCTNNSQEVREKIKNTCLSKFGCNTNLQTKESKEKRKSTLISKLGVEHPFQSKTVQDKVKRTFREVYGVDNTSQLKSTQEKTKRTLQNKFGVTHNFNIPSVRKKSIESKKNKIQSLEGQSFINLSKVNKTFGTKWYYSKLCQVPIHRIESYSFINKEDIKEIQEFTKSIRKEKSSFEKSVFDFACSLVHQHSKGSILIKNTKKIISPLELDIYIPEKKVAIECNGIWYHSVNNGTDKYYHLNKTKLCQEKGIRLIHINEWEWYNKQEICKSILSGALDIFQERIPARKCTLKEVNLKEARVFLEMNHIQGGNINNSRWRYGLYYKGELVQLITLGPSRFKKGEVELLRMCTKLNTQVVSGFSKLMSHLPSTLNEVYSYIDRSKFTGKGYYATGWEFVAETEPNYHYYKGKARYTRNQCQKHKLKVFLGEDNFNEQLSETENMLKNGYLQMYDSGNIKVRYRILETV